MISNKKKIRQNFRDAVFKRDNYTCQMCGKKSFPNKVLEEMDSHHLTDRSLIINGGFVPENGITLCKDICHMKAEAYHSTGIAVDGYTPDALYKLINSSLEKAIEASKKLL